MTISILTALVILESFFILLVVIIFLSRKHSKLQKAFDKLLASLTDAEFPKLIEEEIENTKERIKDISPAESDELDLADTDETEEDGTDSEDLSEEDQEIKRALTFRSAYLHAEINAYEASEGDRPMYWHYLAENIGQLIPNYQSVEETTDPANNEFIDEIMQELESKLNKATESNLSLQALLDSLMTDKQLEPDQISIIKQFQSDFHDLNHHLSDMDQKIENSLNLEINNSSSSTGNSASEKALIIEQATNKVNTETNKLKDIIFDQGNKINNLLKQIKNTALTDSDSEELAEQLKALEQSQQETAMCMEVLEMENHRLIEEIEQTQSSQTSASEEELTGKIKALENIIADKDQQLEQLQQEFDSIQQEYMAVYNKGKE